MELAARYLPGLAGPMPAALERVRGIKTCLYTMTPDMAFIVDRHPEHPNVWFAAGFSGHGFKFAPAIGAALADLAITGLTTSSMDFLRMGERFR
jgi:sarcosine oxidase